MQACRRQPPAWFVSLLLSKYPESASKLTQFGQLPLHLAVECGATPEVVNLLIVTYWDGIVAYDQSGRTALDILNSGEMLAREEHLVVFESLQRCHAAYTNFQKRAEEEMNALKNEHEEASLAVKKQHEKEIEKERTKQDEIRQQVKALESKIRDIRKGIDERDATIENYRALELQWKSHTKELDDTVGELGQQLRSEIESVEALVLTVEEKDQQIAKRDRRIELLSDDFRKIVELQDSEIAESVTTAERSMRAMVSSQIALQNQLIGQKNGLKSLLKQRGIELLPDHAKASLSDSDEKKVDHGEEIDTAEAANAAAAAALSALQAPKRMAV